MRTKGLKLGAMPEHQIILLWRCLDALQDESDANEAQNLSLRSEVLSMEGALKVNSLLGSGI